MCLLPIQMTFILPEMQAPKLDAQSAKTSFIDKAEEECFQVIVWGFFFLIA